MPQQNVTPSNPVSLADLEEWICECSRAAETPEKAAVLGCAAQTIHRAREMLADYDSVMAGGGNPALIKALMPGYLSGYWPLSDLIGKMILSPDALEKRDGPGIPKKEDYGIDPLFSYKENMNAKYGKLAAQYPQAVKIVEHSLPWYLQKGLWAYTICILAAGFMLHGALIGFHVITW